MINESVQPRPNVTVECSLEPLPIALRFRALVENLLEKVRQSLRGLN